MEHISPLSHNLSPNNTKEHMEKPTSLIQRNIVTIKNQPYSRIVTLGINEIRNIHSQKYLLFGMWKERGHRLDLCSNMIIKVKASSEDQKFKEGKFILA